MRRPRFSPALAVSAALVLAACATRPPASAEAPAHGDRFVAHGNEPFWSIEADGDRLLWKTPEQPQGRLLPARRVVHAMGAAYTGEDRGSAFSLVIFREPCQDGMSDRAYDFSATWTYGDRAMRGCAERR